MSREFFITGLPRSRTAWLANWFTFGSSFCWHEGIPKFGSPSNLARAMRSYGAAYMGTADPTLLLCAEGLAEEFPDAPWAIIQRDPEDVARSIFEMEVDWARDARQVEGIVEVLDARMTQIACWPNVALYDYEELRNPVTMKHMMRWLTPRAEFNEERWQMLEPLQVQVYEPTYTLKEFQWLQS